MIKYAKIVSFAILLLISIVSNAKDKRVRSLADFDKGNVTYVLRKELDLKGKMLMLPPNIVIKIKRGGFRNGTIHADTCVFLLKNKVSFNNVLTTGVFRGNVSSDNYCNLSDDDLWHSMLSFENITLTKDLHLKTRRGHIRDRGLSIEGKDHTIFIDYPTYVIYEKQPGITKNGFAFVRFTKNIGMDLNLSNINIQDNGFDPDQLDGKYIGRYYLFTDDGSDGGNSISFHIRNCNVYTGASIFSSWYHNANVQLNEFDNVHCISQDFCTELVGMNGHDAKMTEFTNCSFRCFDKYRHCGPLASSGVGSKVGSISSKNCIFEKGGLEFITKDSVVFDNCKFINCGLQSIAEDRVSNKVIISNCYFDYDDSKSGSMALNTTTYNLNVLFMGGGNFFTFDNNHVSYTNSRDANTGFEFKCISDKFTLSSSIIEFKGVKPVVKFRGVNMIEIQNNKFESTALNPCHFINMSSKNVRVLDGLNEIHNVLINL